jgi:dTMP kinase
VAGRFITLEGGEGAGKSTQARLLAEALAGRGQPVLRTREPGGTPGGERLRALLLDPAADWTPLSEALLHVAARAQHVAQTIRPALTAGTWVVCDRFSDSTLAYQGYGQGGDRATITALSGMVGLVPDLTLVLDVSPEVARARLRGRGDPADRYERFGSAFHERVRQGFREIAAAAPARCRLIAADDDAATVHAAILHAIAEALPAGA